MLARKIVPGLAALLVLAVATPALAADPHKGWYGTLDLALTQPAGQDQHYANHVDFDNPSCSFDCTETERLVLDNDDAFTWGAAFGYSWGKMGALQVSYWGFGSNDRFSDTTIGGIYPTVAGYTSDIGGGYLYGYVYGSTIYPVKFEAESDTKATLWDIDYIRPMVGGDKFSVNWIAGLRVAEYRENRFFDGTDFDDGGADDRYVQDHHQVGKGWGFKVGASANMDFTQHVGLVADLAVSFLQANTRGNLTNCGDTVVGPCDDEQDDIEGSDDSQRAEIRDYGLKAVWHQGPVDIFAGFRSSNWEGIVSDPAPPIGGGFFGIGSAGSDGRNDVTFNTWHVGATWKIGG